jgi:formiminotetrahydrofolate cyclodeaminase
VAAADDLTLSGLSRAVEAPVSSTKRALEILEEDRVVVRSGHSYGRADSSAATLLLQLALELLYAEDTVRIVARAADQVEFVGRNEHQLLVLFGREAILWSRAG